MTDLERAIAIAMEAHAGHVDKAGEPYILHPLRVTAAAQEMADPLLAIVAVLHDVAEDSQSWTLARLAEEPFATDSVMEALDAITRREGEAYRAYIDRVALDPIARAVKVLDIYDNLIPTRVHAAQIEISQIRRYLRALDTLENGARQMPSRGHQFAWINPEGYRALQRGLYAEVRSFNCQVAGDFPLAMIKPEPRI